MKPELNEEFTQWYERFFCQSPSLCALKYDDEKMWEAWKAGYKLAAKMIYDNYMLSSNKSKEPQYWYVWRNHKGEVLFHLGDRVKETPIEYKYIGKIKLEVEDDLEL